MGPPDAPAYTPLFSEQHHTAPKTNKKIVPHCGAFVYPLPSPPKIVADCCSALCYIGFVTRKTGCGHAQGRQPRMQIARPRTPMGQLWRNIQSWLFPMLEDEIRRLRSRWSAAEDSRGVDRNPLRREDRQTHQPRRHRHPRPREGRGQTEAATQAQTRPPTQGRSSRTATGPHPAATAARPRFEGESGRFAQSLRLMSAGRIVNLYDLADAAKA